MDNLAFVDENNIPLVQQDEDYDDYNTPNTSRIDEASFTVPDAAEVTSTLRLTQELKQDKLAALYRHLDATSNIDLIDLQLAKKNRQFFCTKDIKR